MKSCLIALAVLLAGTANLLAQETSPKTETTTAADLDFFEKRVRPLLVQRCFECHSAKAEKLKGGLLLDSREGILAGGDSGPAAMVGDVEKSLLVQAIRYDNENVQMPPSGKLPETEIAVLTEWVRRGLPFSASIGATSTRRQIDIAEGKKHWAFQPLCSPGPCGRSNLGRESRPQGPELQGWPRTHIDDFILTAQLEHGLSPSGQAPRRVLIRRIKFDLLGLPPTIDEVREFEADDSPDACERLVERYLASPQYGERWARYWLDLARYCDIGESWRQGDGQPWLYRDWVVRAFNEDMPYDEFVRKQFAADLLPNFQPPDVAALGFLGLSPSYWKELKLDHNVIKQVVAEEWEERIEAIGGTFLGLTLACARCHDHKFDPITQRDYYGLAGVLASIHLDDRPIIAADLATLAAQARNKIKELQSEIDKLQKMAADANATETTKQETMQKTESLGVEIAQLRKTPNLDIPLAFAVTEASLHVLQDGPHRTKLEYKANEPQDVAVHVRGNAANLGLVVSRRFVSVLSPGEPIPFRDGSGRRELAEAIISDAAPLAARVIVNRVWAQHFGRGLVTTPSNFGTQGERPTHPELLDVLAARFIEHGWSLKWLHRELVLSACYRQASGGRQPPGRIQPEVAADNFVDGQSDKPGGLSRPASQRSKSDPDNVWLARMPLRRLDVEAWRDAMLAATGELTTSIGGSPIELGDANNARRTIYGVVKRRELSDILRLHDFPDPVSHTAARVPTTTPLQQLFLFNSSFFQARAAALAHRVQVEPISDLSEQIRQAHRRLFQREATGDEIHLATEFFKVSEVDGVSREAAWRQYAQALLGSNEFQFVE